MPPKAKFTKEEIVAVAVGIIRDSSLEAITAKEVGARLGTSTRPMFTWFNTLEELRTAATEEAKRIYNTYTERGLTMTPAFKGFAMQYIRFAMDEPSLFRLLFMRKTERDSALDFLNQEGHLTKIREVVMTTFHLEPPEADWLYENLWIYTHGIATLCAGEAVHFTEEDISEKLGDLCRGLLMSIKAPKDARTAAIPEVGAVMPGSVDSYMKTPQGKASDR